MSELLRLDAVTYRRAARLRIAVVRPGGIGLCQGLFGLFTMYLPPLFPTLLRTTGAGFCYNFGRIAAGLGTVFFGWFRCRRFSDRAPLRLDLVPARGAGRHPPARTAGVILRDDRGI